MNNISLCSTIVGIVLLTSKCVGGAVHGKHGECVGSTGHGGECVSGVGHGEFKRPLFFRGGVRPASFATDRPYFGQVQQDATIQQIFEFKRGGFFVDLAGIHSIQKDIMHVYV